MTCEDLSHFVRVASELFRHDDISSATETLSQLWSVERLEEFLCADRSDAVQLAAIALGYLGSTDQAPTLVRKLSHAEPSVVAACEDALWSIWVRDAAPNQIAQLHEAMRHTQADDWQQALPILHELLENRPQYAEAQHQWAIAKHMAGDLVAASDAYQRTLELNPLHYPAQCALGHLAVEQEKYAVALAAYQAALDIHPNLTELQEVVPQLSQAIAKRIVA